MKKLLFAMIAAVTFCAFAEDVTTDAEKAAKKAAAKERMLEKTGGIVEKAGTGKIVIVNCQKKIAAETIAEKTEQMNKAIRVAVENIEGTWKLGDKLPAGANAAIYIVNDPALPMTLVAAEAHWGVVNVAAVEGPRFNKLFARAAIMTLGGGVSQFKGSPMQSVSTPADLDKVLNDGITFDALTSIMKNLQNIGVTQAKKTTYRKACEEGWAEAPANDYQKVIWEEVHAKPTKPMKIKFDPKKGE